MEPPHVRVHEIGKEIAELYNNGNTISARQKIDELEKKIESIRSEIATHVAAHPEMIATSSAKRTGIETLRATLAALAPES